MSGIINQSLGNANDWGVCGFVGILNALHLDEKLHPYPHGLTTDQIQERLGAEILSYLRVADLTRPKITASILSYTKSFGSPYSSYSSITDICNRIVVAITSGTGNVGLGMPPAAVVDYATNVGELKATARAVQTPFTVKGLLSHAGCIVGCGRAPKTDLYNGLRHWVYVTSDGRLLNWGVSTDLKRQGIPQSVKEKAYTYIPYAIKLA